MVYFSRLFVFKHINAIVFLMHEIVLDIETQKEFAEVGGRDNFAALGVSLVGVYDYEQDAFLHFREQELDTLKELLAGADRVIGYNISGFDWPVLQPHVKVDLGKVPTLDLMKEIASELGFRVSLDSVAEANLNEKKSGHGLEAIKWYRAGEWDKLIKYCLSDVRLTRDLYEYGKAHGTVRVPTREGERVVPASWFQKGEKTVTEFLIEAVAAGKQVEISYPSESAEPFVIEPQSVSNNTVEAYSHRTNDTREFFIPKIRKARVLDKAQAVQQLF